MEISTDGVTISDMSVNGLGLGISVSSLCLIENVNITIAGAGAQTAVYFANSGGTVRNVIVSATSSAATASGIRLYADAGDGGVAKTINIYDCHVTISSNLSTAGYAGGGYAVGGDGTPAAHVMNVYNSYADVTNAGTGTVVGGASCAFANLSLNLYGGRFSGTYDGGTTDLRQSAGTLTIKEPVTLVNGTTSGTIVNGAGVFVAEELRATNASFSGAVDVTGNLAVGLSNPLTRLHVQHTPGAPGLTGITIQSGAELEGYGSGVFFKQAASASDYRKAGVFFALDASGHGRGSLRLAVNNAGSSSGVTLEDTRLIITSGGTVGIATTTPDVGTKLHVVGDVRVDGLPEYADNATAAAGGLAVGRFYHTAGVLKVVIP